MWVFLKNATERPFWTYEHLPHVMEPLLAGGCENIINFGEFWNSDLLFGRRAEIDEVGKSYRSYHAQATRYLSAAGTFIRDISNKAGAVTDYRKIDRFLKSFALRELGIKETAAEKTGKRNIRLLSAVTPDGIVFFEDTLKVFANRIFVFEDEYYASSRYFMKRLEELILNSGLEIISCLSPIFPDSGSDQIIIPSMGIAITVKNRLIRYEGEAYRTYHAKRFTDYERLIENKQKIMFAKKAVQEFIGCAAESMETARIIHNKLEDIYKNAMDFDALNTFTDNFIKKIY